MVLSEATHLRQALLNLPKSGSLSRHWSGLDTKLCLCLRTRTMSGFTSQLPGQTNTLKGAAVLHSQFPTMLSTGPLLLTSSSVPCLKLLMANSILKTHQQPLLCF